ncbi:MAG: hypothetical protein ACLPN1_13470 [Dissulfurispiraceae bacterium]|jgi:hypothetical protein
MKRLLTVGLILLVFFMVACGKKEVKKVSPDSRLTIEAFAVADKLREAYLKNDRDVIERYTTKQGYPSVPTVDTSFDSVELTFNPVLVEIYGDTVHVYVSWTGTWKRGAKTTEDTGLADFVMKEKPLKLDEILRESPFKGPE